MVKTSKEKSFEKASFAELTAQVDGCGADYFVYTELQPITKETHFNFIYFDKNCGKPGWFCGSWI